MTTTKSVTFRYTTKEIVAAQRSRFLAATKVQIIFGLGLAAAALTLALDYTVGIPRDRPVEPWVAGTAIGGVFTTVFLLVYLIAPHLDARLNPAWKSNFHFQITPEFLYYGTAQYLFRVSWSEITKAIENSEAHVLFLGPAMDFLVVPKAALQAAGFTDEFVSRLNARTT